MSAWPGLTVTSTVGMAQSWPNIRYDSQVARREYGTGGISWLGPSKVRLRVWASSDDRRTKVVRLSRHRDHGGRGEAAEALDVFATEVAESMRPAGAVHTLGEALEVYVADRERLGRAVKTIHSYEDTIRRISTDLLGTDLASLDAHQLNLFYGELTDRKLADNSVRATHALIRAGLNHAVRIGWIESSPASRASVPDRFRPERTPLLPHQIYAMVAAASTPAPGQPEGDVVLAMTILTAALTGCRRGELCGLRWEDFDPETRSVSVVRQRLPGRTGTFVTTPKSKRGTGARTEFLGAAGMALVEEYRVIMRRRLGREPEGWFLSEDAGVTPMSYRSLGYAIAKAGKAAGVDVTMHTFRRTTATELLAAGVDPDTAARRMGHSTEVMNADYALGADDVAVAAAELLEARLIARGLPLLGVLEPPTRGDSP